MKRIFILTSLLISLISSFYIISFAQNSPVSTKEYHLIAGSAKPLLYNQENPLYISYSKDIWDYVFGFATCAAAGAAAWAANAARASTKAQKEQNYLVKLNALEIVSRYYQVFLGSLNELADVISSTSDNTNPDEDIERIDIVISKREIIINKLISIDNEIRDYYDNLITRSKEGVGKSYSNKNI